MNKTELEERTKKFAIAVIRFVGDFNRSAAGQVIGRQLLRSGTSVGANYREANRAISRRDFAHKISIAEKEASESQYWLEICLETNTGDAKSCRDLLAESAELLAIFTSIGRSMRSESSNTVSASQPPDYGSGLDDFDVNILFPPEISTTDDR
jgi:four helix bundle protein